MNAIQHKQAYSHAMFDFLDKAATIRDLAQSIIVHACMSKALDEVGEVGCTCMTDFVTRAGGVRLMNITAVKDYMLFVFTPGEVRLDKNSNPVLEEGKSCLSFIDGKFVTASDVVVDAKGKNRKVKRIIDVEEVRRRLAAFSWYNFNPSKPETPYKGKFAGALKSDLKAMGEGKYAATADEIKFLKACEELAMQYGIKLGK